MTVATLFSGDTRTAVPSVVVPSETVTGQAVGTVWEWAMEMIRGECWAWSICLSHTLHLRTLPFSAFHFSTTPHTVPNIHCPLVVVLKSLRFGSLAQNSQHPAQASVTMLATNICGVTERSQQTG